MKNTFNALQTLTVGSRELKYASLEALDRQGLGMARLPYSLKILLENLLRREDGEVVSARDIEAVAKWDPRAEPSFEIAFMPARVLLQDFTGVPAVVDLAAMRDAMVAMGGDPRKINPLQPVELVIDHSVQVDEYGSAAALLINAEKEFERNHERYVFLRWGQGAFDNFKVVPPATGIVHQVNLEYLARVVMVDELRLRLSRHPGRHRLAHHHDQRPGRARLGRRRHRSRGGHARPADLDAAAAGGRLPAARPAGRRRHRHRPGAAGDRDAADARRGGQIRRVLRPRPRQPAARRPRHHRQHGARIRRHLRHLPGRPEEPRIPAFLRPAGRAGASWPRPT